MTSKRPDLSVSSVGSWALQHHKDQAHGGQERLSVSSVGSWALQRGDAPRGGDGRFHFQYPQSDRGRCNSCGSRDCSSDCSACCCQRTRRRYPEGSSFQYPQSDRGRCNDFHQRHDLDRCLLSVSSVGSWALQLTPPQGDTPLVGTFSILSRIVGAATGDHHWRDDPEKELSVSSVGSWALQHANTGGLAATSAALSVSSVGSWALQLLLELGDGVDAMGFQYPQSDRGRCNGQHAFLRFPPDLAFSILSRIVGAATTCPAIQQWMLISLSVSSVGSWALQPDSKLLMCSTNVLNYG